MRQRLQTYLLSKYAIVWILALVFALTLVQTAVAYFVGIAIALVVLWSSGWDWKRVGAYPHEWLATISRAIAYSIILYVFAELFITVPAELAFGAADLHSLEGLRGNLQSTLVFILYMWIIAAAGEEFLFRGFYLKSLAACLDGNPRKWTFAALVSSLLFALMHRYQGLSGMVQTGMLGLAFSYIFFKHQKNLALLVFVHGFFNTFGLILIYLNSERVITEYILNHLKN